MRVRPAPAGAALRGLDGRRLRRRASRSSATLAQGGVAARRHAPLRRGGDAGLARACRAPRGSQRRALGGYLGLRRRRGGCLMIFGWEGERESVRAPPRARGRAPARRRRRPPRRGRRAAPGSTAATRAPTCATRCSTWACMVETLETSHTWSRLGELYEAVGGALRGVARPSRDPGIVFCHLSHAYADGASLYFTFIARAPARRGARAVARGQDRRLRGDRRRAGARSPTTTPSAATTPPTWGPRSGSSGSRCCARSRSASTRPGS